MSQCRHETSSEYNSVLFAIILVDYSQEHFFRYKVMHYILLSQKVGYYLYHVLQIISYAGLQRFIMVRTSGCKYTCVYLSPLAYASNSNLHAL